MLAKIRGRALDFLARREHSKFELENKLNKKGFSLEDVKEVLQDLASKGLQSDHRFIEGYVNMRSKKGFGPLRIKLELRERGIDKEIMEEFLVAPDLDWFDLAKIARSKKFGEKIPKDFEEKAKQMRYLSYKGFAGDHINRIFKE